MDGHCLRLTLAFLIEVQLELPLACDEDHYQIQRKLCPLWHAQTSEAHSETEREKYKEGETENTCYTFILYNNNDLDYISMSCNACLC